MTKKLTIETKENGVRVLTFNRPDALNALNLETMLAFWHAIRDCELDETLRVLVLTGAGDRAFCSGGDLVELREKTSTADARFFTGIMVDALHRIENLPVPVIAAINGYALGGGSEIALACDMRIIDEATKMGMVQINMGLTPGWGAGQRLLRLVGYSRAMELLLKGEVLRADTLLELGLANKKVSQGTAQSEALTFASEIADRPPDVVRGIKTLLQAGLNAPYDEARQTEFEIFPDLWVDKPHIDAVEAFFERQAKKQQETE